MEERLRYLFQCYLDNSCTQKELEEFFNYTRRSGSDEQLRQMIRQVYTELRGPASLSTHVDEKGKLVLTEPEWLSSTSITQEKKQLRTRTRTTILFAGFVVLMAGLLWKTKIDSTNKNTVAPTSLTQRTTARSESKFVVLADSTRVWLNAASTISYPDKFDPDKREVFLNGEAYFDVKHADKTPFIIHTGSISTTVLGTAFNIKAYPGEKTITVSVSRGKVKVSNENGWTTTLVNGQQVKVEETNNAKVEKEIPIAEVAAWQQGNMVYDDETLAVIIADLERIYNVEIGIASPELGKMKISTAFKKEIGIEQALQVLCKLTDTELKKASEKYFIQ